MPVRIPSHVPMRELLVYRRLAKRDRRLQHVLRSLRAHDVGDPPPHSVLQLVAELSAERESTRRRVD